MSLDLVAAAVAAWVLAAVLGITGRGLTAARALLAVGAAAVIGAACTALPGATAVGHLGLVMSAPVQFRLAPEALWLTGFGMVPAVFAVTLRSPFGDRRGWVLGAALALIGSVGVFGLQEGIAFLIAWELMSLGGALMVLAESDGRAGTETLFMLALLELGTVALMAAFLVLSGGATMNFTHFAAAGTALGTGTRYMVGLLLILGFGAKLGLMPFYEWFPGVYGRASGATGALLSGAVLNAAYFGLSRGLMQWLPGGGSSFGIALTLLVLAVLTAIFAILYAFQEDDWRDLLSLSTAENAGIACTALAAALLFRHAGLDRLAGLGWLVALIHLSGHPLAKGALFLTADGACQDTGGYRLSPRGTLRRGHWFMGAGALVGAMSLAAMPPTAGFVSEWFVFQTVFQGFHLPGLAGSLLLAMAGAGLALTAAVALATFIKVMGIGLLGDGDAVGPAVAGRHTAAVGLLGMGVLATAVAMPWLLPTLNGAVARTIPGASASALRDGVLLVPLTSHFAFISPTKLIIAGPLLALIPLALWWGRRFRVRRAPAWYGGLPRQSPRVVTTPLAFSNALRTFYSMVYRPTQDVHTEHIDQRYFLRRLSFDHDVAPIFGPLLFRPAVRLADGIAARLQRLQSGHLNFYLALIGLMLVLILLSPLL